jgi:GTP-binding protein HflX
MKRKTSKLTQSEKERCILIGVSTPLQIRADVEHNLNELSDLVLTADGVVVDKIIQERKTYDSAFYIGKGKASQISQRIQIESVDMLVFDDELSPAQIHNWEKLTEIKVIDRSALILDIFASHARSREARTQVELAQLTYLLPRLTRQWTHLSRQVGGIGTKGPGETQLETDRRLVRRRISHLKNDLMRIERQRTTQQKRAGSFARVSLIGYTNAGKSTLLNRLTGADVHVENKLFATLDTTTRRLRLNQYKTLLLSDTVGFINKLPHHLIASFQSTLAQTKEADLLLHIVDLSNPAYSEHIQVVSSLIQEMGIETKPTFVVFNKVDKVSKQSIIHYAQESFPEALFVSAKNNIRVEKILKLLNNII